MNTLNIFASESNEAEGLAALGIDWKILLFQTITFLLVFLFFKKFVIKKIYSIIDARDQEINSGLDAAVKAKTELASTQNEIDKILGQARTDAENLVLSAKKESNLIVQKAELQASKRADKIVEDAKAKLDSDVAKAHAELKEETARLISEVSGAVIEQKLTSNSDMAIIRKELEKQSAK